MTVIEVSKIVTDALTAFAAIGALALSWHNSRKIREVRDATNGMKTELVDAVRKASLATGKAEGLAQGRAESHP